MGTVYDSVHDIKIKVATALKALEGQDDGWLEARLKRIYSEAQDCMMWIEGD
jgi:hypothetical protein